MAQTTDHTQTRPKILLMAYECAPNQGSERAVGWHRVLQASREFDVHVIVSAESYVLLSFMEQSGRMPPHIHFYTPKPDLKLGLLNLLPIVFVYNYHAYQHWQRLAWRLAETLHAQHPFALVHHVNGTGFREPGYTWRMGIPFIWGPAGGTQNFPEAFLKFLPWCEAWKERIRTWVNRRSLSFKPRVQLAAAHAHVIFAANSTNQRDLQKSIGRPIELLLETGIDHLQVPNPCRYEAGSPLRILWTGELATRKALPLLLFALARVKDCVDFELQIVGRGPREHDWKALTRSLGLAEHTTFLGRVSLDDSIAHQAWAQLFAFTSLRDTSGNVMLEALSAGVPVLCFDHQGARDIVTESCGIKLPVVDPESAINDLAAAILDLSRHPEKLRTLSAGAQLRASHYLWEANGDRMNALYHQLAHRRPVVERHPCGTHTVSSWQRA